MPPVARQIVMPQVMAIRANIAWVLGDNTYAYTAIAGAGGILRETDIIRGVWREFMAKFNRDFMVWGDDRVVAAWLKCRKHAGRTPENTKEAMFLIEDLIRAFRRDVGHRNRRLSEGDIFSIFINDMDTVLPRQGPQPTVNAGNGAAR